jgi:hypothetical protein
MGPPAARIADGDRDPLPVWFRLSLGALLALVASLGLLSTAAALAGALEPVPVAVAGVVIAAAAAWCWLPALAGRPGASGRAVIPTLLMVLVAVGFVVVNVRSAGEHVLVDRDPGVYLATAGSLAHDGGLIVDTGDAAFGHPPPSAVSYATQGFTQGADRAELVPQFLHLFPSLLGTVDGVFGLSAALALPAVLGGLALLAVYAWATRVLPPWLALLAVTLLAVSLPQVYFARDAFSEETTQLFIFGGLWALAATDSGRTRDRRVNAVAAGVLFGLAAMTRIDAYVVLALVAVWGAAMLVQAPRGWRLKLTPAWVAAGAVPPAVLGIVDALVVSRGDYLGDVLSVRALGASAAVVVAFVVAVALGTRVRGSVHANRKGLALGAGILVVLVAFSAWFVRPAVQTSRSPGRAASLSADEQALQAAEGVRVDGTRTYNEDTVVWLAWYLGPVALAAGLAGLGFAVARSIEGRWPPASVAATLLIGGMTALYAWNPRVAPDQIWAMRRFLPVSVPGLLVLGTVVLHAAWRRVRDGFGRWPAGALAALVGLGAAASPLLTTSAAADTRELLGARAAMESTCRALPDRAMVLIPGDGPFAQRVAPALRALCHVDVAVGRAAERSADPAVATDMAMAARQAERPFALVSGVEDPFGPGVSVGLGKPSLVFSGTFQRLERTLESVPDRQLTERLDVFVLVVP